MFSTKIDQKSNQKATPCILFRLKISAISAETTWIDNYGLNPTRLSPMQLAQVGWVDLDLDLALAESRLEFGF